MDNNEMTLPATQPAWLPISIKYGVIFGIISGLVTVVIFMTNSMSSMWIGAVLGLVIAITGIILSHKEFKRNNDGLMSYGQGFKIGTVMSVVAGLISGIITYAYVEFIDPTVLDKMNQVAISMLEKFNFPEDQLEEAVAKIEADNTPIKQLTNGLINGLVGGIILSLIVSAFTKKNRPEFE